ncbi:hypothetical protein C8R44DRAFT_771135 [Mycena epipterygia]|nr:hypothetical protein C8R44DRAFT_771135 [Mycena epipterygia]
MSSPFASKLGTNYCPKDKEIAEIKALIVEPTVQLKRLDDEIADMQKAIGKLITERDKLGAYVEGHKALISPARQLPLDIIQEIFTACIPTHRNCVMSASEAPVLLGRICSSWRTISLSTPRLWARLHVVGPARFYNAAAPTQALIEQKLAQRLETTKTWLDRSGQCPLSISLESSPEPFENLSSTDAPNRPSTTTLFLRALMKFAPPELETLLDLTETDVPLLKGIALHQHPYHQPAHRLEWRSFGMLRACQISSFSISVGDFTPSELPLRWSQLTSLSISGAPWDLPSSEAVLQAISGCPALRSCKVFVRDNPEVEIESVQPILALAFLHTLELSCGGSMESTFRLFFPRLSLPVLRDFTLNGLPHGYRPDGQIAELDAPSHEALDRFFAGSTCMERLDLDNAFAKSSLLQIIRGLPPTIQCLRIHDVTSRGGLSSSLDDDVLTILTPAPGLHPPLCPALQEFVVEQAVSISDAAVLQFITARMAAGLETTLKHVDLKFNREIERDVLPSMQPFIESGLEVSITYRPPYSSQFSPWQGLPDAPLAAGMIL